jgi:Flp pilus assembly protein TadG
VTGRKRFLPFGLAIGTQEKSMQNQEVGELPPSGGSEKTALRQHLRQQLAAFATRFIADRRGNVLIMTAAGIFVLIGAAGLGAGVAAWYGQQRDQQNGSDMGANSGVLVLQNILSTKPITYNDAYAKVEARSAVANHGYTGGQNNTTVAVNVPAATGTYTSANGWDHKAIEVIITRPASGYFASIFGFGQVDIASRSVAIVDYDLSACLIALGNKKTGNSTSNNLQQAFQVSGAGSVNIGCGIAVDSYLSSCNSQPCTTNAQNNAVYLNGATNNVIKASYLSIDGGLGVSGSPNYPTDTKSNTGSTVSDPYSSWTFPTPSSTILPDPNISVSNGQTVSLAPGTYSGITISGGSSSAQGVVDLSPGTYFVEAPVTTGTGNNATTTTGAWTQSGAKITCSSCTGGQGVTIVLDASSTSGGTPATISMAAGSNMILNAPTTGANAGMLIVQNRNATLTTLGSGSNNCTSNCNVLQGGPLTQFTGVIYIPQGTITWSGNPQTGYTSGCTQLIADAVIWSGNGDLFVNNCSSAGVTLVAGIGHLAE